MKQIALAHKIGITVMTLMLLFVRVVPAFATDANGLAIQINAIAGLTATAAGNTVTVIGSGNIATAAARLNLNIDPLVTVDWRADLTGALATTNYLITLNGSGTFETHSCTISNLTGTAGVINISEAGVTFTVGNGASILSDRSGNTIHIGANDVTLNILSGGVVGSLSGSTTAAIQVADHFTGVKININGGIVNSDVGGYAISDGPSSVDGHNNTIITIDNNGSVIAGTSTAIRSSGTGSVVEIRNGTVSSSGTSSLTPTINMSEGTGLNVIVSGGTVENTGTTTTSYTIQTAGNVEVSAGAVINATGRAINLTGMNATATVSGGSVRATGVTGIAISTATSTPANVANASMVVTGGVVSSVDTCAIKIVGANSTVTVSGGKVIATGKGDGIRAETTATNSRIIVSGGLVMANIGYAIRSLGNNSTVIVSDTPDGVGGFGGPGGQVAVLRTEYAILSNRTVTVNGGLVFAYGTNPSTVISAPMVIYPVNGVAGMVGVWDKDAGTTLYLQETSDDLVPIVGGPTHFRWYLNPAVGNGIDYTNGITAGFFPLNMVTVVQDYGLIFDAASGNMYKNVDGTGNPSTNPPFSILGSMWTGVPGHLTLNGFYWKTKADVALTIFGGHTQITLIRDNHLESTSSSSTSCGIFANNHDLTIGGSGTLTAKGSPLTLSHGIDLLNGSLTINSGIITAQGLMSAINCMSLSWPSFFQWSKSVSYSGSSATTGVHPVDAFVYNPLFQFIVFRTLEPVSFTATQLCGVSGLANSTGIVLTFSQPVTGLTADDITITNGTGAVVKGALSGYGDTWTIVLNDVIAEGTVNVKVAHFDDFFINPDNQNVTVYKAVRYNLTVNAGAGGTTVGDVTGLYLKDSPIEVTATPNIGYHFTSWTVTGVVIAGGITSNPALFDMPNNAVTLTANFAHDPELILSPLSDESTTVGVSYSRTLNYTYNYGSGTISFTASGLPAGLTINPVTGLISGIPTVLGLFAVTVTVSDGLGLTSSRSFTLTVTPIHAYTITIITSTGGKVKANKSTAHAGETITLTITPGTGYELASLSIDGRDVRPCVSTSFTMPACDVTIKATFQKTARQLAWEAIIPLIEKAIFTLTQQQAPDEVKARYALAELINALISSQHTGLPFQISPDDIVLFIFNPANSGTTETPSGENGYFEFRVTPPNVTPSVYNGGSITASPVYNEPVETHGRASLRAWVQNGQLYVSGLQPGTPWHIYSLIGTLEYTTTATEPDATISLPKRGIYIIKNGINAQKVIN